ncbi:MULTISPECIES: helix-turn-helix domain-containing protein [unclassified Streptomyces]|uniref:helix-turn-helix domain-containing protein n=1 Tax=unclassified Streptomyces TaxID=2593676 RepID=UPI003D929B67
MPPSRLRRLTDQEGQKLQPIVRQGSTISVRYRRAMMLPASAGGNRVPMITKLVQADEDTVRDAIHRFNEIGLACLSPRLPARNRQSHLRASLTGSTPRWRARGRRRTTHVNSHAGHALEKSQGPLSIRPHPVRRPDVGHFATRGCDPGPDEETHGSATETHELQRLE